MTPLKVVPRLLRVASVLLAYRLDELVDDGKATYDGVLYRIP